VDALKGLPMRRFGVAALGEALVDFLPSRRGPLATVPAFERHPGGAPANVAIGAVRLGVRVLFTGAVGDDPFGAYVAAALADEGVDVTHLARIPGQKTGLAFVSLDDAGQPRFYSPGQSVAELRVEPAAVDRLPLEDVAVVHFSTALLRDPGARAATFRYVERARGAGCLVAFDPNLRLHHWKDPAPLAEDVARLVAQADVVKLSDAEIGFVAGTQDAASAARRLVAAGPRLAVVTTGPNGCAWARRTAAGVEAGAGPAPSVEVVDTTGAGDAFHAALVAGLALAAAQGDALGLPRRSLEELLQVAAAAGARVCERMGAVAGLPRAREVKFDAWAASLARER
jgi:fructokinase